MNQHAWTQVHGAKSINCIAAKFVQKVETYDGVKVTIDLLDGSKKHANGRSLLGVLGLDTKDKDVRITVSGENQSNNQKIADELATLLV